LYGAIIISMHTLLFLVPDLHCHGYAKQAALLATALPRDHFAVHVGVMGQDGVFSERLKQAGMPIHAVGASRSWLQGLFGLRRLLRELSPDAVQAWGGAVRWAGLVRMASLARCTWKLIAVEPPQEIWLRSAAEVVVHFSSDAERIRHPHPRVIPIAVEEQATVLERDTFLESCSLPSDCRFIFCAGAIEKGHGFREAVWIFDILKYVYPNLWLLIAGDGPQRLAVEAFSHSRGRQENRVKFLGIRNDIPKLLGLADLAWVCGRRGGRNFALEALAVGCPVVAPRRPEFVELLGNHEAGILVASEAASEFAQASRRILDDPALRSTFGDAGRARAARYGSARVVKQWLDLYAELFSPAGCHSSPLLSP
jgi:glycosyltransferase involved in cell wall biosynthesis